MRNILLVVKNNLLRLKKEKLMLCMLFIILPIVVALGIYFSNTDIQGKIAVVVSDAKQEKSIKDSLVNTHNKVSVEFLNEMPTKTELIKGVYLAAIDCTKDDIEIIAYGKQDVKNQLEASLKGEIYEGTQDNTTVEGKIIGFLIMFLFFCSIMILDFWLTDRENGVYARVLTGNLSYLQYILGQILYLILVLTIPTMIISLIVLKVSSVNLNISMTNFMLLLLLVGLLSASFAIFIGTIFYNKASVQIKGSMITMITCLLGGCIINIQDDNGIIAFIRSCIPQKRLIDLANNANNTDLYFLLITMIIFILISVATGKRQYESGRYI